MMKKLARILLKLIGGLIGLFLGALILGALIASIVYSPEYVRRIIAWGDTDVHDYLDNFPSHPLEAAPTPFTFNEDLDEEQVSSLFEAILGTADFDAFLEAKDTQAFIVIQDDAIRYERYFHGAEGSSMMTSYSVAKSFTSALIGIAIKEGAIESVNDPITQYLPELAQRDSRFIDITIRDLLMMASGLEYKENRWWLFNGDDPLTSYYTDQRQAAMEFTKILDAPGEYFLYNKYHPQLLGLILERSTGKSVTTYLQEKLWNPIGMEFGGSWSIDSEESDFEKMETGVNARAIDFAKFGRLFLENGRWDGEQVIPESWIAESTQVDSSKLHDEYYRDGFGQTLLHSLNGYYSYMWYGYFREGVEYDFAAEGDHGQYIYVSPSKNLIIIRNGFEYGSEMSWDTWVAAFYQFATEY
jgi:CubicO group peptidase (beta-lactamase class C family)